MTNSGEEKVVGIKVRILPLHRVKKWQEILEYGVMRFTPLLKNKIKS